MYLESAFHGVKIDFFYASVRWMMKVEYDMLEPRYLVLTAQDECWDTSKPLVFLGEWCRVYDRRSVWESLEGEVMVSPFSSPDEAELAFDYVEDVYDRFLPIISERMNQIHGQDHTLRYWKIVIGPWLRSYISVVYDRFSHVRKALDTYPKLTTTVMPSRSFVTPVNTLDFTCKLLEDTYNHQLYSKIFIMLGKKFQPVELSPSPNSLYGRLTRESWKHKVVNFATKVYVKLTDIFAPVKIVFRSTYFPIGTELELVKVSPDRILLMKNGASALAGVKVDEGLREKLKGISFNESEFESVLSKMIPSDLPQCFLELFELGNLEAKTTYPKTVSVIMSANSWYYDEKFKLWAARSAEKGAVLLGTSHGGNYGALLQMSSIKHELSIVDKYYSWGWQRLGCEAEVLPMPATKLINLPPMAANNQKEGILWVATTSPRYLTQFPNVTSFFQNYLLMQKVFLTAISQELLGSLLFRPHYQDNGWGIVDRLKCIEPSLAVDPWSRPFRESLESCRLYVCDHLSTTFIEALAANKPTILFWDDGANRIRKDAEPYFFALKKQGILFHCPKAASEAASAAYIDVEAWWNNVDRQEAVRGFCHQFARTSPGGVKSWAEEIHKVVQATKNIV